MKYISTRKHSPPLSFSQALQQGLAPDGGLYVPEFFPQLSASVLDAKISGSLSLADLAPLVLQPFLTGDPLQPQLTKICRLAFNFPSPLRFLDKKVALLELFHGPTAAFKDFGARFLAEYVLSDQTDGELDDKTSSSSSSSEKQKTVLVATSGDTGGAVAGAFFKKPGVEVIVLYPQGRISERQEKQIAGWGENIKAIAVRGNFDDCQRIVKEALNDSDWRKQRQFIAANSISIGRLLPQVCYFAHASLEFHAASGKAPGIIVPTGNLGNAVAALWAKHLGFPIGQVVLATNANQSITDFFATGDWKPHPTVATLANAMDVGNPSNMERLLNLYPQMENLKKDVETISISDAEISAEIQSQFKKSNLIVCPHTAVAFTAFEKLGKAKRLRGDYWILAATAHAAKFESIVEPLIGQKIDIPPTLASLLEQPLRNKVIEPSLAALKAMPL